jgi:hypothetical protein
VSSKNLIAINTAKNRLNNRGANGSVQSNSSGASHLILTSPKNTNNNQLTANSNNQGNSLPLTKEKGGIPVSQSYDQNLGKKMLNDNDDSLKISPSSSNTTLNQNLNTPNTCLMNRQVQNLNKTNNNNSNLNSPKSRTNATPNLQKYYSFQKNSFSSLTDTKCSCFNMPFVCEICTARFFI